ncbi:carboxypeptidase M32 [Alicyclobacillus cellulosilyticus]|uniref:Metal-dependent carboxypeptidase n=1 Tax=Alicyclobacillus cellulosilyticus TaxID=1003997 RepID=A0A917NHM1_9BACL|nr:carboxypeptidase M32 [Alicyclobacillus cellulosilyticus]GGJ01798.1 carboxypeptidase M32 [Alicyclobacillus cellulosilyticus]
MTQSVADVIAKLREHLKKISHYQEAVALLEWDARTGAPRKGAGLRAQTIGTLAAELFRLQTAPELAEWLERLTEPAVYAELSQVDQAIVRETKRDYDLLAKIPADRFAAYKVLTSEAQSVWEEAKAASDFARFAPYLEQIVAMKLEFIDHWGYGEHKYDALLDQYEPGMTVRRLDELFGALRTHTVALVQEIVQCGRKPDTGILARPFDVGQQRALSIAMLQRIGYDFEAGRLDETVHPFMTTINRYDNRVTTKFVPDDLRPSLFGTIHEGGHALYEQAIDPSFIGTPLATGTSMGIHESQSRFYENMIGRSLPFWEGAYGELVRLFPAQFADVPVYDFYCAINAVEPSLIRIEADEVTYNLHIMVRYDLEKALIEGDLRVADLPEAWRAKMQEYLGIVPPNDALGVLQDVHWSGGDFGYFPSYALGNLYAAQFRATLQREVPGVWEEVRRGNLGVVKAWLNEKIHRFGKLLTPGDIVQQVTGEPLDARYWTAYLDEKYRPIYGI